MIFSGSEQRPSGGAPREKNGFERLLTAAELAEILGFASGTIQDWVERGEMPCFKFGGQLRFRESEILEWLEERRK